MSACNYSLVIPVFNSEKSLRELFTRVTNTFQKIGQSFEIIFVEDGSQDESWNEVTKLKQEFPDIVRGIRFTKNFGQHNALLCGFRFTKGEWVITMDDDLQTPPEEISKLINKINETKADLVYGKYETKQHSLMRNTGSRLLKRLAPYASGNTTEGSSFRIISKDIVDQIGRAHV